MHPAFRSTGAAAGFGVVLIFSLLLPVLLKGVGLPAREQAFSIVPTAAGPVAMVENLIYEDSGHADVLFVGSSLIKTDVHGERLANLLSERLGRPMRVDILEMNWYGADQQFFMLQDYLAHHAAPKLIVLHVPQARAYENGPHPQAYRWLRYGDVAQLPAGFPAVSRLQLYGEMVLGAPRQLLSLIRPNLIGIEDPVPAEQAASAVGSTAPAGPPASNSVPLAVLAPATSSLFQTLKPSLQGAYRFEMGPYTVLFLQRIATLARSHGSHLVLIHLPLGQDPLTDTVQEIEPWATIFDANVEEIAVPKSQLFAGVDAASFYFQGDNHMNSSGGERFTESIAPSVAEAYLAAGTASVN